MGDDCGCGEEKNPEDNSAEEKVEKLKKSISELGFEVEETKEGIKISE
jgi:predicted ArsR family transcriptional regulator